MNNNMKKMFIYITAVILVLLGTVVGYKNIKEYQYNKAIELGINYLREEKYEEAILAFEKALSIDSKNEDVKEYLELSKVYKEIVEAEANGDYDKVKELIEKIKGMKYIDIVDEKITVISISSSEKEYNEKIELGKSYIGEDKIIDSILTFESAMNIEYENNEASEYRDVVKLYEEIVQVYNNQQYDKALELIEDISPMKYSNLVNSKVQSIKNTIEETKRKIEEEKKKKEEEIRKKQEEERNNSLISKRIIGRWKYDYDGAEFVITESTYGNRNIPYTIIKTNPNSIIIELENEEKYLLSLSDNDHTLTRHRYNPLNDLYSGLTVFTRVN